MNTEEYKSNARDCGILVGDRVLITRKAEDDENGWYGVWLSKKDGTIGKTGKVCGVTSDWDFHVHFEDEDWDRYIYPHFVLRRVYRSPIVPRFSIGDQVLIKRAWEEGECGTRVKFTVNKIKTIGKVGEIVEVYLNKITHEIYYCVKFENMNSYACPEFVLREVTNKPNPDFEFEPFDTLLHITGPTLSR